MRGLAWWHYTGDRDLSVRGWYSFAYRYLVLIICLCFTFCSLVFVFEVQKRSKTLEHQQPKPLKRGHIGELSQADWTLKGLGHFVPFQIMVPELREPSC